MLFTFTDDVGLEKAIVVSEIETIQELRDRGYGDPRAIIQAKSGKQYYAKESHRELYVRLENALDKE